MNPKTPKTYRVMYEKSLYYKEPVFRFYDIGNPIPLFSIATNQKELNKVLFITILDKQAVQCKLIPSENRIWWPVSIAGDDRYYGKVTYQAKALQQLELNWKQYPLFGILVL